MDGWVTPESSSTNAFNRDYGGTPSSGTGPSDGASGDYYVYAEASSPNDGAVFTMYKYTGGLVAAVNFSYHMYGADMGTVLLQGSASVDDDGSSYTTLWSKSGNSGNSWLSATVRVSSSGYDWLRFHYTSGTSYYGDFALDDIQVKYDNSPTAGPTLSFAPTVIDCYTVRVSEHPCFPGMMRAFTCVHVYPCTGGTRARMTLYGLLAWALPPRSS